MGRAEHLTFFAKFIEAELGIVYSDFNDFQLERRLQEVALKRGYKTVSELHLRAVTNFDFELKNMVRDVATNNETYFFRDPQVFETLRTVVLPRLFENAAREGRKLRIWSMACSYGQEAYSAAILGCELKSANAGFREFEILATDIASHAVGKTRNAVYSAADVGRGLEARHLNRYFEMNGVDWRVKDELRRMVRTETSNLLSDPFGRFGTFDLILCRNVLIYQAVENKMNAIRKIKASLGPQGVLLLGAGETMVGLSDPLPSVNLGSTILYMSQPDSLEVSRAG